MISDLDTARAVFAATDSSSSKQRRSAGALQVGRCAIRLLVQLALAWQTARAAGGAVTSRKPHPPRHKRSHSSLLPGSRCSPIVALFTVV
jgi:hypothetical protein